MSNFRLVCKRCLDIDRETDREYMSVTVEKPGIETGFASATELKRAVASGQITQAFIRLCRPMEITHMIYDIPIPDEMVRESPPDEIDQFADEAITGFIERAFHHLHP